MNDTAPASASRPLWRRLLKPALVIAALAVVFGWLLPRFIDYDQVWDALTDSTAGRWSSCSGSGSLAFPPRR